MVNSTTVIGLDIGEKRIGVARVDTIAQIPQPIAMLINDQHFINSLDAVISEYQPTTLVVGLPRNLDGQETAQTIYVKNFAADNLKKYNLPITFQDETLSSRVAEERLTGSSYKKGDVDAMAAVIILEDYIGTK